MGANIYGRAIIFNAFLVKQNKIKAKKQALSLHKLDNQNLFKIIVWGEWKLNVCFYSLISQLSHFTISGQYKVSVKDNVSLD